MLRCGISTHIGEMTEDQRSLIKTRHKSFAELIRMFLKLNVPQITTCEVTDEANLVLNGTEYHLDVDDYRGVKDAYVFYNTSNGRIYIERSGKGKAYKLEVSLFDE